MRSWDMGTGEPWEWRGRGIAQVERRKWDWGQREGWWSKNCEGRCGTRGVGHVMCNGGLTRSQQNYNRILEETWLPSACIHFNHGNDRKSEGEPSLLTNDLLSYTMHFLWSSVLIISRCFHGGVMKATADVPGGTLLLRMKNALREYILYYQCRIFTCFHSQVPQPLVNKFN